MTTQNMRTFHEFLTHFWDYLVTRYISHKIQILWFSATVRKEHLKIRKCYPKNSQICCVIMTKQIFRVWYMYFIPCFYSAIIHTGGIPCIVKFLRNLCDLTTFVCPFCNHGTKYKQPVPRPCLSRPRFIIIRILRSVLDYSKSNVWYINTGSGRILCPLTVHELYKISV